MSKTALTLMIITLISKVTGLIREQFFAYYLGTTELMDVYSTASAIPLILFTFIIYGTVSGFIPIYTKIESESGVERANKFTSNVINILLVLVSFFIVIMILLAPVLVSLFAPGYAGSKRELTITFTRILSFGLYATTTASIFIAFFQIRGRFIVAELQGIIMNFLYVIALILSFKFNNFYILAFGVLISEFLKYMLFPYFIKKEGYKHSFKIDLKDEYLKNLIHIVLPILAMGALDLSTLVDQAIASLITDGGVSALKYAGLILNLVSGIIIISISTSLYPKLAKLGSEKKLNQLKSTFLNGISFTFVLIIPAIIGIIILAEPLIKILFERGNFDINSTKITSDALKFYIPSLIGNAIIILANRSYYSLENAKIPVYISLLQVFSNLILNIILSQFMGLNGLALGTTLSSIGSSLVSLYIFAEKYKGIKIKKFMIETIKIIIVSSIMGVFTYITYIKTINLGSALNLGISILVSILIYAFLILFAKIPSVVDIVNTIYRKFKRKNK